MVDTDPFPERTEFYPETEEVPPGVTSLDYILDVPVEVTAIIGRTRMPVRDLLHLAQSSVIELSTWARGPIYFAVNGRIIAEGESVVLQEKFGIRLTKIYSMRERLDALKMHS